MSIYIGKRGLIFRKKNKNYSGYKIYGRKGIKYTRNNYILRRIWN